MSQPNPLHVVDGRRVRLDRAPKRHAKHVGKIGTLPQWRCFTERDDVVQVQMPCGTTIWSDKASLTILS